MIDYWLGGTHHFPVDVAAAGAFEAAYGPVAHEFRALRGFLGRVVRRMAGHGIDEFLVVGAGVPAQGNVHEVVPDARVLYVDLDEANVALGQEILAGHPTAAYVRGDATDLSTVDVTMLHATLPGWGIRPTGIAFLGLAAFLDDDRLTRALEGLYDAVAIGSMLAVDFDTDVLAAHPEALALMGPDFRMRPPSRFAALLGRWTLTDDGLAPVAEWGRPGDDPGGDRGRGSADGTAPAAFHGGLAVRGTR